MSDMPYERPQLMANGNAISATEEDLIRDENGFTHPNLHRRIDPELVDGEFKPREYRISVSGTHSYRTTETFLYDMDENPDEIP